ncbi:MAG TPA: hypothetical protein VGY31_02125 [Terriglobia bacterium]|nr:hypothetical protein [Terriglobia bacterium]
MPREAQFALFVKDDKGTLWRGFFNDLDEAKRKAQELADLEGFEFFVYDFKTASEIARFFPRKPKPRS